MSEEQKKIVKSKYWGYVVYPESLPENWKEQLLEVGLPTAISPIHDKDVDENGELKKAHYHLIVVYSNTTTFNNAKKISEQLNQPIPKPLISLQGAYDYLSHENNPEKAQYNKNDIQTLNGFNILDFVKLTKSQVISIQKNIVSIIFEQDFVELADLVSYVLYECDDNYWEVLGANTYFFNSVIKSYKGKKLSLRAKEEKNILKQSKPKDWNLPW